MAEYLISIIDDEPKIANALRGFLEAVGYVVNTYLSAESYLDEPPLTQFSCSIVDLYLPGINGLELQQILRTRGVTVPIIFLSAYGDIPSTVCAIKNGAVDFLTKPVNNQLLLKTIEKAIQLDINNAETIKEYHHIQLLRSRLTNREYEVMELILSGHSNKNIAQILRISHKTVEIHRAKIMQKMQVKKVTELVTLNCNFHMLSTARLK